MTADETREDGPECDHPPRVGGACLPCAFAHYEQRVETLTAQVAAVQVLAEWWDKSAAQVAGLGTLADNLRLRASELRTALDGSAAPASSVTSAKALSNPGSLVPVSAPDPSVDETLPEGYGPTALALAKKIYAAAHWVDVAEVNWSDHGMDEVLRLCDGALGALRDAPAVPVSAATPQPLADPSVLRANGPTPDAEWQAWHDTITEGRPVSAVAETPTGETCDAWGGCPLPRGHNRGRVDIPENHAPPVSVFEPRRGDAVGAWLRELREEARRQKHWAYADAYDMALDDYRLHADVGKPLDQHACDGPYCCEPGEHRA